MSIKREFKITSGPNRDMLFDACKYAYDRRVKIPIQFVITHFAPTSKNIVPKLVEDIKLIDIKHEKPDGDTFILQGFCKTDMYPLEPVNRIYRFNANYNTKKREGSITLG